MTQTVEPVKRTRAYQEPNGSFAVEGSLGSFFDLPSIEGSGKLDLARPEETSAIVQQHIDGYSLKQLMPKSAKYDVALPLQALAARATGAATAHPLAKVLEVGMGGIFAGTGTTVNDNAATVTRITLTSVAGMREGGAVAFATGAGGALEVREIKRINGSDVNLKLALSNAPANGSTAYGAVTCYLDNTDGSTVKALQLALEGLSQYDKWLLLGGQLASPPAFEVLPGTLPKMTSSWQFAQWLYADGSNTTMNLVGTPITDQQLSSAGHNPVADSEFRIWDASTTALAGTLRHAPQITFKPNLKYGPHKTPAGVNTIYQWVRLRVGPSTPAAQGDFAIPYEGTTWQDYRDNRTNLSLAYQIGSSTARGAMLLTAGNIVIDNAQREGLDGIAGQKVSWYAMLDEYTNTNSTNLQKSAFRVHFV